MKIYSTFKDYYDKHRCFSHCSDDFIYIRKTKQIELERTQFFNEITSSHEYKYEISRIIIGFCGEYYLGFKCIKRNSYTADKTFYTYDPKIFSKSINKNILKMHNSRLPYGHKLRQTKGTKQDRLNKLDSIFKAQNDKNFKEEIEVLKKLDLFHKYNTPYFLYDDIKGGNKIGDNYNLLINPRLEDYSFYKAVAPHIAYSEIEMFFTSDLLPKNNAPQIIDDKIKIQQHGFDLKTSFRKAKQKKKVAHE